MFVSCIKKVLELFKNTNVNEKVSECWLQLPTYPSPKSTFCPKREESVNVGLVEG